MSAKHYDAKAFTSSASIGYLTKLAHTLMHDAANEAFADRDLSFMQWLILTKMREGVALTPGHICRAMRHDTGALTRVLDQLEERGLVERERSQQDRRVVELKLTAAGKKKSLEAVPMVVDLLNGALQDFSKAEFQEFTRLLNKLIGTLTEAEEARKNKAAS